MSTCTENHNHHHEHSERVVSKRNNHEIDHDNVEEHDHAEEQKLDDSVFCSDESRSSVLMRRNNTQDMIIQKRLKLATLLCFSFFLIELIGGIMSHSLAILSDAAHLFTDMAAFMIAIAASHAASLPPSSKHTYGLKRAEALAALLSMTALALVTLYLAFAAILRLWPLLIYGDTDRLSVDGKLMSIIATIGVLVNTSLAFVLKGEHVHLPSDDGCSHNHEHSAHSHNQEHSAHSHNHEHSAHSHNHKPCDDIENKNENTPLLNGKLENVNLDAAFLHVLGDLLMSVAVAISGVCIWIKPHWTIIDPLCTLFFTYFVFKSTIGVIRSSLSVLLNEVPPNVAWEDVYNNVSSIEGVYDVHDLHVWAISHGNSALSLHASADNVSKALKDIHELCGKKFTITHTTIQIQPRSGSKCMTCNASMQSG